MTSFGDKVRALAFGPGWTPGKPRLGDPAEVPDVSLSANDEQFPP